MPRGRKGIHKGKAKKYTSVEEEEEQRKKREREDEWRKKKGIEIEEDDDVEEQGEEAVGHGQEVSSLDEESDDDIDEMFKRDKTKGVEGLVDVVNPNRVAVKSKKVTDIDVNSEAVLSRREREEVEKQKAEASYRKKHMAGKTEEAQRDLARLAIIRQQREEAAKKREAERKAADAAKRK